MILRFMHFYWRGKEIRKKRPKETQIMRKTKKWFVEYFFSTRPFSHCSKIAIVSAFDIMIMIIAAIQSFNFEYVSWRL